VKNFDSDIYIVIFPITEASYTVHTQTEWEQQDLSSEGTLNRRVSELSDKRGCRSEQVYLTEYKYLYINYLLDR
jgi:hypothetical protein